MGKATFILFFKQPISNRTVIILLAQPPVVHSQAVCTESQIHHFYIGLKKKIFINQCACMQWRGLQKNLRCFSVVDPPPAPHVEWPGT